jgi:multicomponent Na+:H+ antiporter subunit C
VSTLEWYLWVAAALLGLACVRLLLARDPLVRLIAINVAGSGSLLVLVTLAARTDPPDPVQHALVLTGIVITVAFTGVGLVLLRRIEEAAEDAAAETAGEAAGAPGEDGAAGNGEGP